MTTYTVFCSNDANVARRGLTLANAADELLTQDGYAYEIRPVEGYDGQMQLWTSDGSANSTRGARHLTPTRIGGHSEDEIWQQVIAREWHGFEAMTDADFDTMRAAVEQED